MREFNQSREKKPAVQVLISSADLHTPGQRFAPLDRANKLLQPSETNQDNPNYSHAQLNNQGSRRDSVAKKAADRTATKH
ncbi:MAG: hypothetical protein KDH94_06130, partial [Coxiellaceae bacterium]|nr:hypothetical protein [Coxiellaceae bacterium]